MKRALIGSFAVGVVAVSVSACAGDPKAYLSLTTAEEPGDNCTFGGERMQFGTDQNENGKLERREIDNTVYVCNPAETGSAVSVEQLSPGDDNCPNGGVAVSVAQAKGSPLVQYICNGEPGSEGESGGPGGAGPVGPQGESGPTGPQGDEGVAGPTGPQGDEGAAGPTGATGSAGTSGYNSLILVTSEPAGANCAADGSRLDVGLDNGDGGGTAGDNILQAGEIDSTSYLCEPPPPLQLVNSSFDDGLNGWTTTGDVSASGGEAALSGHMGVASLYQDVDLTGYSDVNVVIEWVYGYCMGSSGVSSFVVEPAGGGAELLAFDFVSCASGELTTSPSTVDISAFANQPVRLKIRNSNSDDLHIQIQSVTLSY